MNLTGRSTGSRRRRVNYYYSGRIHPEVADWLARVRAAGSDASATTLRAMSDFCLSIDAAGIRDRFVRLNLFAGNDLTAAITPLYRGTTEGALVGNAIDENTNFIGTDYVEFGLTGGIVGNGVNKRLNTGVATSDLTTSRHASVRITTYDNTGFRWTLASEGAANVNSFGLISRSDSIRYYNTATNQIGSLTTLLAGPGVFFGSSIGDNHTITSDGATFGDYSTAASAANALAIYVLASNQNGTATGFTLCRVGGYTLGLSMTNAQVAMLYAAWNKFTAALGRPVS
jgi:hypothetical protein